MTRGRIEVPKDLERVSARSSIEDAVLRDACISRAQCDSIWQSVERLYRTGVHPAIGLCIRRRGHVVVDGAIGHARGQAPDEPLSESTPLCDAKLTHAPGRTLEYHALSAGYLLGAIVKRASGRDLQAVIRQEILDPLGFDLMGYGVPREREADVAENHVTGRKMPLPIELLTKRALGLTWEQATRLSNDPRFYSIGS
jgi:hypothetical protein